MRHHGPRTAGSLSAVTGKPKKGIKLTLTQSTSELTDLHFRLHIDGLEHNNFTWFSIPFPRCEPRCERQSLNVLRPSPHESQQDLS